MVWPEPPLILHVIHSLEGGGTERTLVSLLQAFDHSRLRHAVLALRDAGSLTADLPDEVACIARNTVGRSWTGGLPIARICRDLGPVVIHARNVCTWWDSWVASLLMPQARLVLGFHGLEHSGAFARKDRWIAKAAHLMGARFTTVSQQGGDQIQQQLGIPRTSITCLTNGVDTARFSPRIEGKRREVRESLGFKAAEFVVGIVGSLTPVKGHVRLLAAFAEALQEVPAMRLLIVGEGPLGSELESKARILGICDRVVFAGSRVDIPNVLQAMDAYVCASDSESLSNAMLEAMASGLPVISTAVGDHPAVLGQGKNGILVCPGDAGALAGALATLAMNPLSAAQQGRRARAKAEQMSFRETVRHYESFYQSLTYVAGASIARICRPVSKTVTGALLPRVASLRALQYSASSAE